MAISILVTGANGFVGKALCEEALSRKINVYCATRKACHISAGINNVVLSDIDEHTSWHNALVKSDVLVHLAARVHVMQASSRNNLN